MGALLAELALLPDLGLTPVISAASLACGAACLPVTAM